MSGNTVNTQLDFLQMWAEVCNLIIQDYLQNVEMFNPEQAFEKLQEQIDTLHKEFSSIPKDDLPQMAAMETNVVSHHYVRLLIMFGCFEDDGND